MTTSEEKITNALAIIEEYGNSERAETYEDDYDYADYTIDRIQAALGAK